MEKHRQAVQQTYVDKLKTRMQELIGSQVDPERFCRKRRCWRIAATSRRNWSGSRPTSSISSGCSMQGGEVGKKLDFLLQEMNREANTLLSKTSGLAGEALKITEMGLAMKTEIEKAREQVQNIE